MLLAHPNINVNLADTENHWTALHRALYNGNITIAVLLVQRPDIDISLKDFEGYTAFDLYNSTVEGTRPVIDESRGPGKLRVVGDLFTWGANRNATLGVGDGDDRAFPEQITVESAQAASRTESSPVKDRFAPTRVRDIVMSKLHTGVVTEENRANLYVCGFGSGGRCVYFCDPIWFPLTRSHHTLPLQIRARTTYPILPCTRAAAVSCDCLHCAWSRSHACPHKRRRSFELGT